MRSKVEISVDAGKTWKPVALKTEPAQYLWTLWEYEWHTPKISDGCTLMVRATERIGKKLSLWNAMMLAAVTWQISLFR